MRRAQSTYKSPLSPSVVERPLSARLPQLRKQVAKNWDLYLFILPTLTFFVLFRYVPMYGVQIAFKEFAANLGIMGSPWVGFEHFRRFFRSFYFWTLIRNTTGIALYSLAVAFPVPILLALALNEMRSGTFKRFVQTVTYAPHFISTVVMAGIIMNFLSPSGMVNTIIRALGGTAVNFMTDPRWFKTVYVLSGVWQNAGWSAIIYLAVLTSVDVQLYDAAAIDGATRLQKIAFINIPTLMPTILILLILNTGSLLSVGFEKVFLLQTPLNLDSSEVISTYVYRTGLVQAQYGFSAAIGLFNSVINFVLLATVNLIARSRNQASLW